MVKISKYLNENLVQFLKVSERDEVIHHLVDLLNKQGKLFDAQAFYEAIIERERIVSTGIGMSVAIPHAKMAGYEDFFIAIGILDKGVNWNALDGSPVRLIFMIGGPDDKQTEYLQILSSLTSSLKDDERRKKMLTVNSANAIIQLFKDI